MKLYLTKWFVFLFCLGTIFSFATESEDKVVVYVDMVGDMFHEGHVELFKKARAFGNYLLVGVLSDASVEEYKRTPILTMEERIKVIEACKYVDEVVANPPLRPTLDWLQEHKIRHVVHGDDFSSDLLQDQYASSIKMGILRIVPYTPEISTTGVIHRIIERYKQGEFQ
jgi:cytidyltransferase-like protein